MRTDRRGFIGALIALPFLSRLAPAGTTSRLLRTGGTLRDLDVSYDVAMARALAEYRKVYEVQKTAPSPWFNPA